MKTKTPEPVEAAPSRPVRLRAPQMKMPDQIPPRFGVLSHDDLQAQGVAASADIAELAGVFGVSDVSNMGFPYQKHGASDGKKFELRIESSGSHNVAGEPTVGHLWIFRQVSPELTA